MNIRAKVKNSLKLLAIFLAIIAGVSIYNCNIAPTKVGFINYPDFLFTKVAKSIDSDFINTYRLHNDSLDNVDSYDMLLIFGMGINLSPQGEQSIKKAGENGTKIYLQSSTNPRLSLTNIEGSQLDDIALYLDNGGNRNYHNMLNYIRREIDDKKIFSDSIIAPAEIPSDVLFYKDEDSSFETINEFESYCVKNNLHTANAPKVILFTSVPGPFNTNRDHINSMIDELHSRGLNVYPVAGFRGRLNYMKNINPDIIVYMPHGRLSMGGSSSKIDAWLESLNVPVLCPLSVFQKYDKWLDDKQGMFGGLLSQSITMPEFDGGIVPYVVFAQYEDKNGYLLFKAIPDRLTKFGDIVDNYLNLKKLKNKNKKIALVYFKGPGKNALNAQGLEVLPSMHNFLLRLKKEGYDLGSLPDDLNSFVEMIQKKGPILGTYAEGAFDEFLQTGDPLLIPVNEYETWCEKHFSPEMYSEVKKRYGSAPGSYMGVHKNNEDYLAVARLQFGNIVLLPQPLPGIGENEFKLIHGAKVAPPHSYIAPYLWIQEKFNADAVFHFGTHGSLEFTPGKQIALSDKDWTDPLIGTTPHFYIYTIANVGECMMAKRRSYAVSQSYLTPPFIKAKGLANKKAIIQKIHKYEQASGSLKNEYALGVKKLVIEQGIHKDIDLDSIISKPYSEQQMMKLANYLEEVENEKISGGLYIMGVPYTKEKIDQTIGLMFVDLLAYNLAELDIIKNKIKRNDIENKSFFNRVYTYPSEARIKQILKSGSANSVFKNAISSADYARASAWKNRDSGNSSNYHAHMHGSRKSGTEVSDEERKQIRTLVIQLLPNAEKTAFIKKLSSDKEYKRAISFLNKDKRARIKRIAKFIPAMGKALEIASDSIVNKVLVLIKKQELRALALEYLKDEGLADELAKETIRQNKYLIKTSLSAHNLSLLSIDASSFINDDLSSLDKIKSDFKFYNKNKENLLGILNNKIANQKLVINFLEKDFDNIYNNLELSISKLELIESNFASAVFKVQNTINSVLDKRENLANCPEYEMKAILNSLNGGFTPASPGGDPIANPATIPTGKNLYSISAEKTPSREAWAVGKRLAKSLLKDYRAKNDDAYPKKISFTLWSSSFIETEGTTIAQILYIIGVEPVWDPLGRVKRIRLIPAKELGRPRIDAVVQTSGQLRDLASSRLFLINKAIEMAALDTDSENNFVSKGIADAEKRLIEKGMSPKMARSLSQQRVFGGVNGNYGTGIKDMVQNSSSWDSTKEVAQTYINNMGAVYGSNENWGDFSEGVFEAALLNTDAVVQPRQSNTWGALSLDHVYEFMGGINVAIREVTGKDPESYFNDFRNSSNARIQGLKESIWVESRTTILNPRYIKEFMKGGASSAETFAETFRNTFGWNVMKPSVIENRLWDELYDVYVQDKLKLGVQEFFERENPYALQEMTAVMLETVRKGYWDASKEQVKAMSQLHAELVKDHKAGCSGFVCNNSKLNSFIKENLGAELKKEYSQQIVKVRQKKASESKETLVLKKEQKQVQQQAKTEVVLSKNQWLIAGSAFLAIILLLIFIGRLRKRSRE